MWKLFGRVVVPVLFGAVLVLGRTPAAHAGGSTWEFPDPERAAGDTAFAWANVAWEHNPSLGTPDDGPYYAWISPVAAGEFGYGSSYEKAIPVGQVSVFDEPYEINGVRFGPHHATVEFVVPDVPPGEYELLHCNVPCTTSLGDLTWGSFRVIDPDAPVVSSTTVATAPGPIGVERTITMTVDDGSSTPWTWAIGGGLGATVVAAGGVAVRRARRPGEPPPS